MAKMGRNYTSQFPWHLYVAMWLVLTNEMQVEEPYLGHQNFKKHMCLLFFFLLSPNFACIPGKMMSQDGRSLASWFIAWVKANQKHFPHMIIIMLPADKCLSCVKSRIYGSSCSIATQSNTMSYIKTPNINVLHYKWQPKTGIQALAQNPTEHSILSIVVI